MEHVSEKQENQEVVCLFCGARTHAADVIGKRSQRGTGVSIVRCHRCGKEAPYLTGGAAAPRRTENGEQFRTASAGD